MKGNHRFSGNIPEKGKGANSHRNAKGYCICPACVYAVQHEAGIPCKSLICPDCKTSLVRKDGGAPEVKNITGTGNTTNVPVEGRKVVFPQVMSEKCTACGACIDVCPASAIVLRDGKAFVINDFCRNCKICLRVCRFNAFKLA